MESLEVEVQCDRVNTTITKLVSNVLIDISTLEHNQLNLWELFEQLSVEDFVSLKKNVYFADFLRLFSVSIIEKESLPNSFVEESLEVHSLGLNNVEYNLQKNENEEQVKLDIDTTNSLNISTRLEDLSLPNKFQKLITRLRNVSFSHQDFTLGETLGDIISLSTYQISRLPGVGSSYVKTFEELKSLVRETNKEFKSTNSEIGLDITTIDTNNMRLSLGGVDKTFIKALDKYAKHIDIVDLNEHIDEVLNLDRRALLKLGCVDNYRKWIIVAAK